MSGGWMAWVIEPHLVDLANHEVNHKAVLRNTQATCLLSIGFTKDWTFWAPPPSTWGYIFTRPCK